MKNTIGRKLVAALALGMLFTSCKKDDDGPGGGGGPVQPDESYFPSKTNTVWKYRSEEAGEITEHNISVVGKKDSAGGKVINLQTAYNDGSKIFPYVYATSNQIVYGSSMPAEMADQLQELEEMEEVSDISVTGMPMLQKLPAAPKVNDAIQFSEPLHIGWKQADDEETYDVSMDFTFNDGKVVAFEDVTTPAGTFKNAMKLQYKATFSFKFGPLPAQESVINTTSWYAKGIGVVKSVQVNNNKTSTTVLTAIQ